ncbi:MAG: efflux RND transporter periplasmic adaptor subunit [Clostridiales bacterium]|nr:efflux RND transporter periplasmic adaptor subunit [Clostridiales bacterium]
MSEEKKIRKNKKWIVKALIAFLIVMGILTFFSNTIMNMTLTQVSTQQIYGATLSSITRAQGTVKTYQEKTVKAPGEITVGDIGVYLYGMVEAGDTLATISLPENREDLEQAKKNLEDLEKEMEYDERKPSENSDFYNDEMAVIDAEKAVEEAEKALDAARNKDQAIAECEEQIRSLEETITQLEKDKNSLEGQKYEAEVARDAYPEQIDACQVALDAAKEALAACITDTADPAFSQEALDAANQAVTDAQQALDDANAAYEAAMSKVTEIANAIVDKSAEIESKNNELLEKNADLATFNAITTVEAAERTLSDAKHTLTVARKTLSDAKTNAGITSDQKADEWEAKLKKKEEYEKEIARLEEYYAVTEITAPISGMVTSINVTRNATCLKDEVMFTIADLDSGYYIECSIPKKDAEGMYIGSEVKTDYCDSAFVESIRPDPLDPMNSSIVRITVTGYYLTPGATTVNCTISTSNRSYENVVPKGALQQDTEGYFIYILVTKNSPLGERYIARKVAVKLLAEDATSAAIEGAGISYAYCIVRSGKPITNGEQVRLAQGESN